jgi:hypothetical protein
MGHSEQLQFSDELLESLLSELLADGELAFYVGADGKKVYTLK